jgi:hypothetical protein
MTDRQLRGLTIVLDLILLAVSIARMVLAWRRVKEMSRPETTTGW